MNTMSLILSAIIQVIIFSAIPCVWWLITARKKENFFKWIGLKKPIIESKKNFVLIICGGIILFSLPTFIMKFIVDTSAIATSQFVGLGSKALIGAFAYSFIQTGLSEEIFFRGFLGKRLCAKLGFNLGNFLQSALFGILHGIMISSFSNLIAIVLVIVFTGSIAWVIGWINESKSEGSIIPSWLIHSTANMLVSIITMFNFMG